MRSYYPSNGTDGEYFMEEYCNQCANHDPDDNRKSKNCDILAKSFFSSAVIEWTYDANNHPVCTSYKHHDWSEGEPEVVDPNQLELFGEEK